ncbi:MAG TPA: hypothetical protein ENK06_11775 [Gammaproteobacteria bacterium]|nr:hypothetical protein [Gammaproteobacteria bacterium]
MKRIFVFLFFFILTASVHANNPSYSGLFAALDSIDEEHKEHGFAGRASFSRLHELIRKKLSTFVLSQMEAALVKRITNDWRRYTYLHDFVARKFTKLNDCEQKFLVASLLYEAGIDTIYGYSASSCHILASSNIKLYQLAYIYFQQNRYYVLAPNGISEQIPDIALYNFGDEGRMLNFEFTVAAASVGNMIDEKEAYAELNSQDRFVFSPQKMAFFKTHPQMDYIHYIHAPMSEKLVRNLENSLLPALSTMDDWHVAQALMDYIQYNIAESKDVIDGSHEKVQFMEETLFYKKGDCEDRVILYAKLLNLFLKRPMLLVKYERHLALAIALNDYDQWQIRLDGKKYTIADPSIKNGRVGDLMSSLVGETYVVRKINFP